MKNTILVSIIMVLMLTPDVSWSQENAVEDSLMRTPSVIGGIYDRPYIYQVGGNIALGGYVEMNSNSAREEGISEGFSFEARRFNLFVYSSVSETVKLTSELEFEHGTEEIKLETALIDILLHTSINFRAGILLSPIGKFNIAHDSPRYNIIERPLVSTQIIPATLSEAGVGFFGALYPTQFDRVTYEVYATNGLGDGVVGGSGAGTRISAGKSAEAFQEDNNGRSAFTGRLALNPRFGGEFGLSFHTGAYNTFKVEGDVIAEKRNLTILAIDAEYKWKGVYLRGEAAIANIDVPEDLLDIFGEQQKGFYSEIGLLLMRRSFLNFTEAELTLVSRYDYVDLNTGNFNATGQDIGDSNKRLTLGLSFRPSSETSVRLSYFRQWQRDPFNNLKNSANIQFGVATYF